MQTDHPDFIQCANNAFEQGVDIDIIECLCHEAHSFPPAASAITYPSALNELLDFNQFAQTLKRL